MTPPRGRAVTLNSGVYFGCLRFVQAARVRSVWGPGRGSIQDLCATRPGWWKAAAPRSGKEVLGHGAEVVLGLVAGTAQRLTVADLLHVVEVELQALVAVLVVGRRGNRHAPITAAVAFACVQDGVELRVHHARLRVRVYVDA